MWKIHTLGSNRYDPVVLWIDEPDESCIELLRLLTLQPENRDARRMSWTGLIINTIATKLNIIYYTIITHFSC